MAFWLPLFAVVGAGGFIADRSGLLNVEDTASTAASAIGTGIGAVISTAGPAIVEGVSTGLVATREAIREKEAEVVASLTAVFVMYVGLRVIINQAVQR
jgi:hypothetical protein